VSLDIRLENFEGPLDLLLHLIRKNEMDICDIQIADITAQYLTVIETMKSLNLDVAGEFVLMAATLIHIKSKMLLPLPEDEDLEEEELDPRAELIRRLLEYQKYKAAASELDERPLLGRDVFTRQQPPPVDEGDEGAEFVDVGIFDLVEVFQSLMKAAPPASVHEVNIEHISITERINHILHEIASRSSLAFNELFSEAPKRNEIVATFLAMLELVKMRTVRLMQSTSFGSIWIFPAVPAEELVTASGEEEDFGYL
jgi:segregation and condensation protein A